MPESPRFLVKVGRRDDAGLSWKDIMSKKSTKQCQRWVGTLKEEIVIVR